MDIQDEGIIFKTSVKSIRNFFPILSMLFIQELCSEIQ